MSKKESKKEAAIEQPGGPREREGKPGKAGHHEGPAGAGSVSRSKFNKDDRDPEPPSEKEPGKSRGAAG